MPTQAQLASAAWLHIGGASGAPRCLARREDVSPLWCLLLAGATVMPAVTVPEPATEVPRQGLRVEVEQALRKAGDSSDNAFFYHTDDTGNSLIFICDHGAFFATVY